MVLRMTIVPLRDILVTLKLPLWPLMKALVPLRRADCSEAQKISEAQFSIKTLRVAVLPPREAIMSLNNYLKNL